MKCSPCGSIGVGCCCCSWSVWTEMSTASSLAVVLFTTRWLSLELDPDFVMADDVIEWQKVWLRVPENRILFGWRFESVAANWNKCFTKEKKRKQTFCRTINNAQCNLISITTTMNMQMLERKNKSEQRKTNSSKWTTKQPLNKYNELVFFWGRGWAFNQHYLHR